MIERRTGLVAKSEAAVACADGVLNESERCAVCCLCHVQTPTGSSYIPDASDFL